MIAVASALTLIFMIMLILTRALVAALVIVGTAASTIAAAFGLSVLIWQDLVGLRVYWVVQALAVIVLLAVGSDYNLLLVSRFKEEIHAGLKTGIIRSMAGTGGVVTAAGLVFAFTMASMVGSDMRAVGGFGSTVSAGLLLDTLIVRTLLTPSIATLLGRWFWWPQVVHTHAAPPPAANSPARGPAAEATTQPPGAGCDESRRTAMRLGKPCVLAAMTAAAVALAPSAHADIDTDFADELHGYGIYGQRDHNAWQAKITCKRLDYGLDSSAEKSTEFLSHNLPRGTTTAQPWQFLAAAIRTYCDGLMPVLTSVAEPNHSRPLPSTLIISDTNDVFR